MAFVASFLSPPQAAYVHIPFCHRRCFYCDFPVYVVGDRRHGGNFSPIDDYVEKLCLEIRCTASRGQPLKTIFFGGGTPSLLTVEQLAKILQTLIEQFGIISHPEISLEMDPATFDQEKIQGYRQLGVNRVSLGVQAFQDDLLKLAGRSHLVHDIYAAITMLRFADIKNISIDLISGLPTQTLATWQATLEAAIALEPQHISSYDLIVEPQTAFARYYQVGESPLPSDQSAAKMYCLAQEVLTVAGYKHYEISNYAKPGYECKHNYIYWQNQAYYGFGMGAASYVDGIRYTRPRKTREYYEWVKFLENQFHSLEKDEPNVKMKNSQAVSVSELNNLNDLNNSDNSDQVDYLLETLMLKLRLAEGININEFSAEFGLPTWQKVWQCLLPFYQSGWIEIFDQEGKYLSLSSISQLSDENLPITGHICLSDPTGFLFSNSILSTLFSQLDYPERVAS